MMGKKTKPTLDPSVVGTRRKLRCGAKSKRTGQPCQRWAVNGGRRCPMHGLAKGTRGRAKAEEQLQAARDELMAMLLAIARDETLTANERLKAITWALERAGFRAGVKVEVEDPLWVQMLRGMFEGEVVDGQRAITSTPANPYSSGEQAGDAGAEENLRRLEELRANPHPHPHWSDYGAPSDDPAVIEGAARRVRDIPLDPRSMQRNPPPPTRPPWNR